MVLINMCCIDLFDLFVQLGFDFSPFYMQLFDCVKCKTR